MNQQVQAEILTNNGDGIGKVPVGFVPIPTVTYRTHHKLNQVTIQPGKPVIPPSIPLSPGASRPGARVLTWKQDPSVGAIGVRKAYLPGLVLDGPQDTRIEIQGLPTVTRNAFGDFIQTVDTDAFDAVHTFAVVRQALNMYQRALFSVGNPVPWQWNTPSNTDPLKVFPHGLPDTMNAFYSRAQKALKFGHFIVSENTSKRIFTCRSFDIVAHETGHALLDGLKPQWIFSNNPPQTGGLHESFGDLTSIFLALSQLDQCEAIIAQTKGNLHDKTFLADVAEEFGLALGRPNGLRNADNDLKLSEVGTQTHAISQVFTGGVYDILADIFSFERSPGERDDAIVLYEVGQYVCSLVLRAFIAAPDTGATYADVVNQMLVINQNDGKPAEYRNFIRNHFVTREVVVSPIALTENFDGGGKLIVGVQDAPGAIQERCACCGTMQNPEYNGEEEALQSEREAFSKALTYC